MQQIIILKSYIRELSDILNEYKRREEKLVRSKTVLKSRQREIEEGYKGKLQAASLKIHHYDNLVDKLYQFL